ncbi:Uncharacterised protein [Mycobacterium tuberculosis]|uniref:Uncharacterized protein n=1 Tax=Mycobacterium tuberculosis TaxID=1773 RepID=A0A0U0R3Z6_MYCTX|nr:Uncharacterised protein [Mycobacterium tuberculosis]COX00592.1 Uncharacterised protein [Mycobacterium tuberculosis]COZ00307.1 Uncharacterised protein [Mycobacterium tuberculosis]SIP65461.1 hypothetical protein BN9982_1970004 [Mycobacterium tuberculosis]
MQTPSTNERLASMEMGQLIHARTEAGPHTQRSFLGRERTGTIPPQRKRKRHLWLDSSASTCRAISGWRSP